MKKWLLLLLFCLSPPAFGASPCPVQQSVAIVEGTGKAVDSTPIPPSLACGATWVSVIIDQIGVSTVTFEVTNDEDSNTWIWYPISLVKSDSTGGGASSTTTTAGAYTGPKGTFRFFRVRVSAYTSGTVHAKATFGPNASGWQALSGAGGGGTCPGPQVIDGFTLSPQGNPLSGTSAFDQTLAPYTVGTGANVFAATVQEVYSVADGSSALTSNTTGAQNVAVGFDALLSNTTGARNTAVGFKAGRLQTTVNGTTAIGNLALETSTGSNNTAVGDQAIATNTTGNNNTAVGVSAINANDTGTYNTAMGAYSMFMNTASGFNAAFGAGTLQNNMSGNGNTAVGFNALTNSTTGTRNQAFGYQSGLAVTTGTDNFLGGYNTCSTTLTTGSRNLCLGTGSYVDMASAGTNDSLNISNIIQGSHANSNTIGNPPSIKVSDVAGGVNYLDFFQSATGSSVRAVAEGSDTNITFNLEAKGAGFVNLQTGPMKMEGWLAHWQDHTNHNVALGETAANATISQSGGGANGQEETFVGYNAGNANTTGARNTAVGSKAALTNATGNDTTAVGYQALTLATGSANNGIGSGALATVNTGNNNTAVGVNAGNLLTTGTYNAFFGNYAGSKYTTQGFNTAVGATALQNATAGASSVAVGYNAGNAVTTAANGTYVGYQAGKTITTGGNNTAVGSGVFSTTLTTGTGNICIGVDSTCTTAAAGTSNTFMLRGISGGTDIMTSTGINGTPTTTLNGIVNMPGLASSSAATTGTVCWTTSSGLLNVDTTTTCLLSSIRFKKAVKPLAHGLETVMALRPVSFLYKDKSIPDRQVGLIAEDVAKVDKRLVAFEQDKKTPRGVRYQNLTAVLIQAIQEQQKQIDDLKQQLAGR